MYIGMGQYLRDISFGVTKINVQAISWFTESAKIDKLADHHWYETTSLRWLILAILAQSHIASTGRVCWIPDQNPFPGTHPSVLHNSPIQYT